MSKIYLAEKTQLDSAKTSFAVCSTAAATAAKTVTASDFILRTGTMISVKFAYANTAANPTLNVNGTGAKSIYYHNLAVPTGMFMAGGVYLFVYDGARWELMGNHFANSGGNSGSLLESSFSSERNFSVNSNETFFVKQKQINFGELTAQGYKSIFLSQVSVAESGSAMNDNGFFRIGIFDGNTCLNYISATLSDAGLPLSAGVQMTLNFQNITGVKTLAYYIYQNEKCYTHKYTVTCGNTYLLT